MWFYPTKFLFGWLNWCFCPFQQCIVVWAGWILRPIHLSRTKVRLIVAWSIRWNYNWNIWPWAQEWCLLNLKVCSSLLPCISQLVYFQQQSTWQVFGLPQCGMWRFSSFLHKDLGIVIGWELDLKLTIEKRKL